MKDVCVFFATGYEEIEALTVVDILRRGGVPTKMVSITGEDYVVSSHDVAVKMDVKIENLDFSQVEMIVLPGGLPGTTNLEACEPLMKELDAFYESGRFISAICAAPSIFAHRGYLKGREAGCYPSLEDHLAEGGAKVSKKGCTVSDHVTTARGMGVAIDFGLEILERLKGKEAADKMAAAIVYQR